MGDLWAGSLLLNAALKIHLDVVAKCAVSEMGERMGGFTPYSPFALLVLLAESEYTLAFLNSFNGLSPHHRHEQPVVCSVECYTISFCK